jgi:hypothetical protein
VEASRPPGLVGGVGSTGVWLDQRQRRQPLGHGPKRAWSPRRQSDPCGSPSARGPGNTAALLCPGPCGRNGRRGRWSRRASHSSGARRGSRVRCCAPDPAARPRHPLREALRARRRFQQRAINREVIARQQSFDLSLATALPGESCPPPRHPTAGRFSVKLVASTPRPRCRASETTRAIAAPRGSNKTLQQQGVHQPLRRDRLPADRRVQLGELARQQFERRIGDLPNHPQRMIHPNSLLEVYIKVYMTEKASVNPVIATHRRPRSLLQGITMRKFVNPFSAACSRVRFQGSRRNYSFPPGRNESPWRCAQPETGPEDAG